MTKYEVQEYCLFGGWTNTWSDDQGATVFDSQEEAEEELHAFLVDCHEAYKAGEMLDYIDEDSFRIVEVSDENI